MGAAKNKRGDAVIRRYADEEVKKLIARMPRTERTVPSSNSKNKSSHYRGVRNWMREHADDYETATQLAEAAIAEFDLPEPGETAIIWDDAADAILESRNPFKGE